MQDKQPLNKKSIIVEVSSELGKPESNTGWNQSVRAWDLFSSSLVWHYRINYYFSNSSFPHTFGHFVFFCVTLPLDQTWTTNPSPSVYLEVCVMFTVFCWTPTHHASALPSAHTEILATVQAGPYTKSSLLDGKVERVEIRFPAPSSPVALCWGDVTA